MVLVVERPDSATEFPKGEAGGETVGAGGRDCSESTASKVARIPISQEWEGIEI